MPVRPREMNDQPSESRIRVIIRSILNQEVRRLLNANASVQADVATNTSNIAANASAISSNDTDIAEINQRAVARNITGIKSSKWLGPRHKLDDLHDVSAASPSNGEVLTWNNSTSVWEPDTAAAGSTEEVERRGLARNNDGIVSSKDAGLPLDPDISDQQYLIELTASSTHSFARNTVTDIPFDTESADPHGEWDTGTYEFTADEGGLFYFFGSFRLQAVQAAMTRVLIQIRRDTGTGYAVIATDDRTIPDNTAGTLTAASRFVKVATTVRLDAGDKVKFIMFYNFPTATNQTMDNSSDFTRAIIQRISD